MTGLMNGGAIFVLAMVLTMASAAAEEPEAAAGEAAPPPTPCQDQEKFHAFDFWIGEWEVRDQSGKLAGHNVIESAHRGCVLVENWKSVNGGTGMSMNWLDDQTDEWVQVWIDGSGGQIEIRGGMTEEGMQLTGQIHYTANGTTAPFRGLWTPLPDGRIRQYFEQSNDGGETWEPWFEGFYTRMD